VPGSVESLGLGTSWAAHELRGALAGPRVALERVISRGRVPEEDLALLRRSSEELEQLAVGIDAILRAAYGGRPRQRSLNLVGVVRDAAASCLLEFAEERIQIDAPERIEVHADRDQLQWALANLIRNALAYSPDESKVKVVVTRHGGRALVTIIDRGPGIAQGEGESVFTPFVRGAVGRAARKGNGLGLFIARRVVEAHRGSLSLSTSGAGSAFTVELPSRPARPFPAATRSQAG
jgi:two-component system, OmpR family, sensor kinase